MIKWSVLHKDIILLCKCWKIEDKDKNIDEPIITCGDLNTQWSSTNII